MARYFFTAIIILMQVEEGTADVEWKLDGNGPWNIGTDFELIHTPGHTQVRNST
jgi:glyoxylase-like metal-dependent hydrolase (beta-lactamase superfamily II)